jgi:hypothetical protein
VKDNEKLAIEAGVEACKENIGKVVGFLGGAFTFTMMICEDGSWRMSATPLPPNRLMRHEDWQMLDDALVMVGMPAGTKTEEVGAMRHWRWKP